MANRDRSTSIVVKIPKLYDETAPECRCWFEGGMIWVESCENGKNCRIKCHLFHGR
ncbi:MAG: hypothetical protein FWE67_05710 [Planctomycetaceae bacterium]|nr:hypothetical protein [Planctomycetaceae bacterium]